MFGSLGDFIFNLSTAPLESSQQLSAKLIENPVFNSSPAIEFTGLNAQKRSLSITINNNFVDCQEQLDTLIQMQQKGSSYPLILYHQIKGYYSIESLDIQESFSLDGKLISAKINIGLTCHNT